MASFVHDFGRNGVGLGRGRVTAGGREKGRPQQARLLTESLGKGKGGYHPAQQQGQRPKVFNALREEPMREGHHLVAEGTKQRVLRHLLARLICSVKRRFTELGIWLRAGLVGARLHLQYNSKGFTKIS